MFEQIRIDSKDSGIHFECNFCCTIIESCRRLNCLALLQPSLIGGLDCGLDCGLDRWSGSLDWIVDWIAGLDYWTGLLDWITGSNQTASKSDDACVAH